MDSAAWLLLSLVTAAMFLQVCGVPTVIGLYGETIEVPCNDGAAPPEDMIFTKWKYESDGVPGDLLVKQAHKEEATVQATDGYRDRVSIAPNSSLLITQGSLTDQRTYTCMMVYGSNLQEYPVNVLVHKKPSPPEIKDKVKELENGKLTMLGVCVAEDANPAASITWSKNGLPLEADGTTVIITSSVTVDPVTGLSTTSSSLQYTAVKGDVGAQFTCTAQHSLAPQQVSSPQTFAINYPTEKLTLLVQGKAVIEEGDNVTLKCKADGNPPPTSFNFHIKDQTVTVKDVDTYTLPSVTRENTGEYKCSLVDNKNMEATASVVVSYLDLSLSPSGKVLKTVGDALVVTMEKNASGDAKVSWSKDNGKLDKAPRFDKLRYGDEGLYVCVVTAAGITRSRSFHLVVEGPAVIRKLTKQRSEDGRHKVLTCEAEGAPPPTVHWSINGTDEKSSYSNGKATHKITVVPTANLTVSCSVSNRLGEDDKTIDVYTLFKEETPEKESQDDSDQAKLIVGIVVGLIIAAAVVGLVYWLYMKKSRQGSWKTGEKEAGTSEESKKLEENNKV